MSLSEHEKEAKKEEKFPCPGQKRQALLGQLLCLVLRDWTGFRRKKRKEGTY